MLNVVTGAEQRDDEMLDVRGAAELVGRHPETVRRWVWSGRLEARRQGNRLLVSREDLRALAGLDAGNEPGLASWADRALRARASAGGSGAGGSAAGRSAADLVIEDRTRRSRAPGAGGSRERGTRAGR